MKNKWRLIAITCIAALFAMHLPFLHADPDYNLSIGRDAFTDEGLNTSQLRNYVNHGYLSFDECDNLIKSPLFNLILFLPLKIFGTHLIVARLTVLSILIITLLVLCTEDYFARVIPWLFISTLTQYYVFQYSHFSLSEMMAVSTILLSVFFLFRYFRTCKRFQLHLAILFVSLAFFIKIQFIYAVALIPCVLFVAEWNTKKKFIAAFKNKWLYISMAEILLIVAVYFFAWVLPHKDVFSFVMSNESQGKFDSVQNFQKTIAFNIINVLMVAKTRPINLMVLIFFVIGIFLLRRKENHEFKILFVISSIWMILECHKLTMTYLPSRYLVSYYFAAGFMSSIVVTEAVREKSNIEKQLPSLRLLALAFLINWAYHSVNQYLNLYSNRQYAVEGINRYFSSTLKDPNQPVLGVWSTNATWDCKARCIPVWKDFMNDKDVFNRYHPQAILSEPNEDESNQAFSSQGIDLKATADSSRNFQIGRWAVIVYWMH